MMPAGFFGKAELQMVKAPAARLPACGLCGLYKGCQSPKMPPAGKGRQGILVIGDVPTQDDDLRGRHLADQAGRYLEQKLALLGVDMKRDCVVTSALICKPPDKKLEKDDAVEWCRPNLTKTLETHRPERVLLLGDRAVRAFVGSVWRERPGDVTQWAGFLIPDHARNAWAMPTYHPHQLLRDANPVQDRRFFRHLKALVEAPGRPWRATPDWTEGLDLELDTAAAADKVEAMRQAGRPVAFDFETNMLKPDSRLAEIVCCAVSDGKTTVSYPWDRRGARATFRLLHDPAVRKYGYNLKFEERWVLKFSGKGVANWKWDGMIGAHVTDSRAKICGLKFQSYVLLGQPAYDDKIKPYLEAATGNTVNKIRQLPILEVLKYCGLDALLEYKVARLQAGALNLKHLLKDDQ